MAEYIETEIDDVDVENVVLEALAGGHPFAFIVTRIDAAGDLDMRIATGGRHSRCAHVAQHDGEGAPRDSGGGRSCLRELLT